MTNAVEKTYFTVGLIDKVLDDKVTLSRFFKVFEFRKGRVYFEVLDDNNLPFYQQPIQVKDAEAMGVFDNPQKTLDHLRSFRPKVAVAKDGENLKQTLEAEIKNICEKYNLTDNIQSPEKAK